MAPLPPRDQTHLWLRYQDLAERVRMLYTGDDCQEVFMTHAWGRLFEIRAHLVQEFILEFFSTCRIGLHTSKEIAEDEFSAYWLGGKRVIPDKGDLSDYWVEISSGMEFFRGAPSYIYIRDPVRRLCHRLISYSISGRGQAPKKGTATHLFYLHSMDRGAAIVPYLLALYLFKHAEGRKNDARLSRGHFIGRLAHHFGLVSDDGAERIIRCAKRQPVVAAATPGVAKDAPDVDEGAQAVLAPIHAPPPPPAAAERSMTDQGRISTWMVSCMTQLMKASKRTYQAFDGTFQGSYPTVFERHTRRRTDDAST
ncbi:hypothetical protein Tco_1562117 [Tanacetum coccineum]